jgi:transposase
MKKSIGKVKASAIGLDLSDTKANWYAIDDKGERISVGVVSLRNEAIERWAEGFFPTVIAIEAGGNSGWISRALRKAGHDVVVANPVKVALITKNINKGDEVDAEYLARLVRFDRRLLHEIHHRREEAQRDLQLLRSRDVLVRTRTALINHVRGAVKSFGDRLPASSANNFPKMAQKHLPKPLSEALEPVVQLIRELNVKINASDKTIRRLPEKRYPEAKRLMQVKGVGALTAMGYVLVIEDVHRFRRSRSVGPYLGLTPARDQSGESDPERRITGAGDELLRRLLVQSSHYILGPFGPDCDLKRYGEKISNRGGKKAKRRAVTAVARKLAVLLHRLWLTGQDYQPLHNNRIRIAA